MSVECLKTERRLLFISIYIPNFERNIVDRVCHASHSLDKFYSEVDLNEFQGKL
jgi:hypothetical protein